MRRIIQVDRSIIPAMDIPLEEFQRIVRATGDMDQVGAYKIGVSVLAEGLQAAVDAIREHSNKPIIYDHQKAGTDIHESTPDKFMDSMVRAGVDAVILFPQAGPATQYAWTMAAQERELGVIVGGEMTHPRYLQGDFSDGKKEGQNFTRRFEELGIEGDIDGYLRSDAPEDMYELAARMGVTTFVVPGNKPEQIMKYRQLIEGLGLSDFNMYVAPGLVAQGGEVSAGGQAAGRFFGAITGRAVIRADNPREAVLTLAKDL